MKTINATEIKKRGISVVDKILESQDSVPVIHRSKIKYVVVVKETYDKLIGEPDVSYNNKNKVGNTIMDNKDEVREYEEKLWRQAAATSPSFDFLKDPEEDIYSLDDGEPFNG